MAASSVPVSQADSTSMATRRQPLAEVPNKVNSPFKSVAVTGGKRTRAGDLKEATVGQPPTKKLVIGITNDGLENVDPKRRSGVPAHVEEPFARRTTQAQPTAFEKKLVSARERKPTTGQRADGTRKITEDTLESIRQWQRHYKKQFPHFVFYFDGIAEDARSKAARQIQTLGAREEKFFSKSVTHVVTTRPIPAEGSAISADHDHTTGHHDESKLQPTTTTGQDLRKTTQLLDATLQRRGHSATSQIPKDIDPRKIQSQGIDVLSRARGLGIKIWALEKLQRVLRTMFDAESGDINANDSRALATTSTKQLKDASLEQMLRNEKVHGPADRDMTVAGQNKEEFKGCYIYIHDMDEKTKPTMVRDYQRPVHKEQGKWPQFRLTAIGRCPFIEDPQHTKRLQQEEQREKEEAAAAQRRTRAASSVAPTARSQPGVLSECQANVRRSPRKLSQDLDISNPLEPPKVVPAQRQSSADVEVAPTMFGSAQVYARGLPRMAGGQPIASGVQPSNVTSAIRSQVISSAAISSTAPCGRRVGDSKEVSALKRKVLERGNSAMSNNSIPSSYFNDMRAALNNAREPPPRAAKKKAQETLGVVLETEECFEDGARSRAKAKIQKRCKKIDNDPKPGYCENCRDKFDDFEEHIQSRKHRKFALTDSNWKELDALLSQLKRPHKDI